MCGVGFAAVSKTRANMGRLKRMCQDAYRMTGAVQETSPYDMLRGQGADFLRWVALSNIIRSSLLR